MVATINADTTNGVIITSDTSGEIALQANGVTKAKVTANGLQDANGASLRGGMYRNLIINGDMRIAQRGTSSAGITSSGYYTVDRWYMLNDTTGTWTQTQDTDVPTGQGFANSLKLACTTADASLAAGDGLAVQTRFEGQNLQQLKKGTANAESVTFSFWVKSNKTGTYIYELYDQDNARQVSKSYTISLADTWEKKKITISGDTTGALDNDNGLSLYSTFWLAAGSNKSSGTLNTSWAASVTANRVVGQVNLADSTSNYINITGVQLEVGSGASDFEFLPYDVQLARCQRYFEKYDSMFGMPMHCFNANTAYGNLSFKTVKRAAPTVSHGSPYTLYSGGSPKSISAINFGTAGNKLYSVNIGVTTSVTLTAANAGHFDIDSYLWIDSEL
jgi:hypothetical protein